MSDSKSIYDPYKALEAYIETHMYEDAMRLLNDLDTQNLIRLKSKDCNELERARLFSKRTAAEKLRNIILAKQEKHLRDRRKEHEMRLKAIEERRASARVKDRGGIGEYHIDSDVLEAAELNETEFDFSWMEA